MDRLCGPDSLPVVCNRFSNGVEVLKCVSGFIKEVSDVEQSYSNSIQKLVKSPLYELHSNFIMQLLGSTPHQEIGTVKHTWSELGNQLSRLAALHADKAKAYMTEVRQPLLDLAPILEEARKEIRNRARLLRDKLEAAAARHHRMKIRYQQTAEEAEKYWQKVQAARSETLLVAHQKSYLKHEERFASLKAELRYQESVYEEAHKKHVEARESFDRGVKELYTDVQDKEIERVNTIKKALKEFARALSNTVPVYLEAMKTIVISLDQIDSNSDIDSFVGGHGDLTQQPRVPALEKHPTAIKVLQDDGLSSATKTTPSHHEATPSHHEATPSGPVHGEDLPEQEHPTRTRVEGDGASRPPSIDAKAEGRRHAEDQRGQPAPSRAGQPAQTRTEQPAQTRAGQPAPSRTGQPAQTRAGQPAQSRTGQPAQTRARQPAPGKAVRTGSELGKPVKLEKPTKPTAKAEKPAPEVRKTAPINCAVETADDGSRDEQASSQSQRQPRKPPASSSKPSPATKHLSVEGQTRHSGGHTEPGQTRHSGEPGQTRHSGGHTEPGQTRHSGEPGEEGMLLSLQEKASDNDYYKLLRVLPNASAEELAGARRERTRQLHPDHFANDDKIRESVQTELVKINQAYQDVLREEESRDLYNQLCAFRQKYYLILKQRPHGLRNAHEKLLDLRKRLKRLRCPQALVEELDSALHLIQTRINKLEGS